MDKLDLFMVFHRIAGAGPYGHYDKLKYFGFQLAWQFLNEREHLSNAQVSDSSLSVKTPWKIEIVILLPGQLKIALHLLHSVARPSR